MKAVNTKSSFIVTIWMTKYDYILYEQTFQIVDY